MKACVVEVKDELQTSDWEEVLSIEIKGVHKSQASVAHSNVNIMNPTILILQV